MIIFDELKRFCEASFMTKFEELRTNAGLTITQLSIEANVSRATIDKIEKGEAVRAPLAARACTALSKHLGYHVTYQELGIKTVR
jgi:transcriptional regulator with XRE-family HTH domain